VTLTDVSWIWRDRRRSGTRARLDRLTWPLRHGIERFWLEFPCNILGRHAMVEDPITSDALHRSKASDKQVMRFKCRRCPCRSGGTN
jgi:hypothetical protein